MGGCFAQDYTSAAVETYWPAHSVCIDNETIVIKSGEEDLTLPFWRYSGLHAGFYAERLSMSDDRALLTFGMWVVQACDYLWIGPATNAIVVYGAGRSQVRNALQKSISSPVDYMRVGVSNCDFTLELPDYTGAATMGELGTSNRKDPFYIRIIGEGKQLDMVAYWWCDDVRRLYFMAQPMASVARTSAIFTHGYNILTEL